MFTTAPVFDPSMHYECIFQAEWQGRIFNIFRPLDNYLFIYNML